MTATPIIQTYRIAPMYRRCCWYAVAGMILCLVLIAVLDHFGLRPKQADDSAAYISICMLAVALATPLTWQLQVTEQGISRRRALLTDVWTWADIASGRLEKKFRYRLRDPARPLWRRSLSLDYMTPEERGTLWEQVNSHYKLPPSPELPDSLTIKLGWNKTIALDGNGIHIVSGNALKEFLWQEVEYVVFLTFDHLRRDFYELECALPSETISLKFVSHQGGTSPTWRGAAAEEIYELLQKYVPGNRIETAIYGQEIKNSRYIDKKRKFASKELRQLKAVLVISVISMTGLVIWAACTDNIWKAVYLGVWAGLINWVLLVILRQRSAAIERLSRGILETGGSESTVH